MCADCPQAWQYAPAKFAPQLAHVAAESSSVLACLLISSLITIAAKVSPAFVNSIPIFTPLTVVPIVPDSDRSLKANLVNTRHVTSYTNNSYSAFWIVQVES